MPDLADMVLDYCWTKRNKSLEKACFHGNFEEILRYFKMIIENYVSHNLTLIRQRRLNIHNALRGACHGGYLKIVCLVLDNYRKIMTLSKNHIEIDWTNGYEGAMNGGYNDSIRYILYHYVTGVGICLDLNK